jgi:hypothetical protein
MRRSARLSAAAHRINPDAVTFASLPLLQLACRIFLALPADARGRASCVCRAWRDALAEPALWARLDMSLVCVADDEAKWQRFLSVLHGAAAQAANSASWTYRTTTPRGTCCFRC